MARKFRCSIYVDIFIDNPIELEIDRDEARRQAEEIRDSIPNSYVGGVATMDEILLNKVEI